MVGGLWKRKSSMYHEGIESINIDRGLFVKILTIEMSMRDRMRRKRSSVLIYLLFYVSVSRQTAVLKIIKTEKKEAN